MSRYPGAYEDGGHDERPDRGHMAGPSGVDRKHDQVEAPLGNNAGSRAPMQASPVHLRTARSQENVDDKVRENSEDLASETASVVADLEEQSQDVEDGLLTLPLDVARDSVTRWARTLRSLNDARLDEVIRSLSDLSLALETDDQGNLNGTRIGQVLSKLGLSVRGVARERTGVIGMALDRLGDCLVAAAQTLRQDLQ